MTRTKGITHGTPLTLATCRPVDIADRDEGDARRRDDDDVQDVTLIGGARKARALRTRRSGRS